jgi:toxin ParE1/3/4
MSYTLEIQKEAIAEIQEAYEWYESQRTGLGDELIEEIESCLATISEYPERYGYVRTSYLYRRIRVSRFPYMIVYEIEGNTVFINSIVHFKQDKKF